MADPQIRVLIVEDETVAARRIRRLIEDYFGQRLLHVAEARTVDEAVAALLVTKPDLVCLDLFLVGADGFQLLRQQKCPHTIVVSAYVDRAIEAFDHQVVDFVVKPVEASRFQTALRRFDQQLADKDGDGTLSVRSTRGVDVVPFKDIVCILGADDYVEIVVSDGRRLLDARRLNELETIVPRDFARVHRSHIVNLKRVTRLEKRGSAALLLLECGQETPVSRRGLRLLKASGYG